MKDSIFAFYVIPPDIAASLISVMNFTTTQSEEAIVERVKLAKKDAKVFLSGQTLQCLLTPF